MAGSKRLDRPIEEEGQKPGHCVAGGLLAEGYEFLAGGGVVKRDLLGASAGIDPNVALLTDYVTGLIMGNNNLNMHEEILCYSVTPLNDSPCRSRLSPD